MFVSKVLVTAGFDKTAVFVLGTKSGFVEKQSLVSSILNI